MYEKEITALSPLSAFILAFIITGATLFGVAMGKKMEKIPMHIEIPSRRRSLHLGKLD